MDFLYFTPPVIVEGFIILVTSLYVPGAIFAKFLGTGKNFHLNAIALTPLIIYLFASMKVYFGLSGAELVIIIGSVVILSTILNYKKKVYSNSYALVVCQGKHSYFVFFTLILLLIA